MIAKLGAPAPDLAAMSRRTVPVVVPGAVIGLTWAAALRGWMIQIAGYQSTVHWYGTFALVLAPGLCVGALLGLAEQRRRTGGPRSRWLVLAPCLFLVVPADPAIFKTLITTGPGGGAIGVVLPGLAGGYAVSDQGHAWWRRTCGVCAVLGILLVSVIASDHQPPETARGAWVGLYGSSLIATLCLACAIPQRIGRSALIPARWIAGAAGALCGLAWACALRAFMWEVAEPQAEVEWAGTFLWILLPGALIGALLGSAEFQRWTGAVRHRRWLIWSPMLFAAVLLSNRLDLLDGFEGGIGLAAVAVPAMCMLGGYAIAGTGLRWTRGLCGLVALSAIPIWSVTAVDVGGASMSLRDPHGAWAATLYWALLATFSMAAAIPYRGSPAASDHPGRLAGHREVQTGVAVAERWPTECNAGCGTNSCRWVRARADRRSARTQRRRRRATHPRRGRGRIRSR
jgi:hypothetical protein